MELPKWMKTSEIERRVRNGRVKKRIHVEVNADAAYLAFFAAVEARQEKIKERVEDELNLLAEEKAAGRPVDGIEPYKPDALDVEILAFDKTNLDQYWLEVAYQCIKMDCQRFNGMGIDIRIRDRERKYCQANYREGRGAHAATQGKEARNHYMRMCGSIPGA